MRMLNHKETLLHFDVPILISATDNLGVNFVCLLIEQTENEEQYLCIPLSKGRFNLLKLGEISLREAFVSVETNEYYIGNSKNGNLASIQTHAINSDEINSEWLPDDGTYLESKRETGSTVFSDAIDKQRAIIHCTLNPPESFQESKITAEHLSEAVRLFQRLIKHTYESAIKESKFSKQVKELVQSSRNYTLEIYGVSEGSFTIHMQTAEPVDLLGYANIAKALEVIDTINFDADDPQIVIDTLSRQNGHFVSAYKDLLQFVVETNTPFAYEWSMPSKKKSTRTSIVPRQAKPLYEAISERSELGKEEITLTGRFSKIDEDYNKWRLISDDNGKRFYGDSYVKLGGIVIETVRYELVCEEVLEEDIITKKETRKLYLKSYKEL